MERQIDTSIFISHRGAAPGHVGIVSAPEATFRHRRQKSRRVARAREEGPFNSRLEHSVGARNQRKPGQNRYRCIRRFIGTKRRPEATIVDAKVGEANVAVLAIDILLVLLVLLFFFFFFLFLLLLVLTDGVI